MITRWDLDELVHEDAELYHHGVMGMRWGHRKQQPTSGVSNSRAARRKRIIRNVAIGAGAAAAVGAGLYIAKKKGLIGRPKVGTVSNASLGKMTNRHTVGVGSKYLRTPTLNGYFNGQGKALSVGKKPISSLNRSGSGQVKRLISNNKHRSIGTLKVGSNTIDRVASRKHVYKPAANTPFAYDIGFKGNHQKFNTPAGGLRRYI